MMPKSSEIEGLLSRLEAATGPDRELDHRLQGILVNDGNFGHYAGIEEWVTAGMEFGWNTPAYTASIDAAIALVERVEPRSWHVHLGTAINSLWASDTIFGEPLTAPDVPLYLLPKHIILALLRSLSARPRP